MKVYSNDDYTGVKVQGATLESATITSPQISSPTVTGTTDSSGPVETSTLIISDIIAEKAWSFQFAATGNNQKFDLYCASTSGLESLMDITVTTGVGTLARRYSLQKQGTGIIQTGSRYNEVIGNVPPYLAISDIEWDVINLRWRFKIVNRVPLGTTMKGSVAIRLVANTPDAHTLINTFGVSNVYMTDITTYPEPVYQFSGAISADALITNFIKKGVNYTLTNMDSILICTAGIIVTLPDLNTVGVGRSFTIKNTQNSGVTLKAMNSIVGGVLKSITIDGSLQYTIGNGRTITVTTDGTQWWITSAF